MALLGVQQLQNPKNYMWIVRLALRWPYTLAVLALAILIAGAASHRQTPKYIFPEIKAMTT